MQKSLFLIQVWIVMFGYIFGLTEACECGRSSSDRIYGGHAVSSAKFPWMAQLYYLEGDTETSCGASIISTLYAVTAGHCAPKSGSAKSYLIVGDRSFDDVRKSEAPNVEKFIVWGREDQDLALVKLKRSVNVVPICLPPTGESFAGVTATMLGYGLTESGSVSSKLLAGNIVVPSNAECNRVQTVPVDSTHICGGNYGGGPAFCSGDSGGPLLYHDVKFNRWILIGVVAESNGCSDTKTYGVFTRVSSFVSWIQQKSNNAGCQIQKL